MKCCAKVLVNSTMWHNKPKRCLVLGCLVCCVLYPSLSAFFHMCSSAVIAHSIIFKIFKYVILALQTSKICRQLFSTNPFFILTTNFLGQFTFFSTFSEPFLTPFLNFNTHAGIKFVIKVIFYLKYH